MQVQSGGVSRGVHIGLIILAGAITLGRFVPGAWTWGFNQFAYLPGWMFVLWLAGCVLAIWPRCASSLGRLLDGRFSHWLLGSRLAPLAAAGAVAALALLLGSSSHFLGDGTWLAASVESGRPFHFFDFTDYRLHLLAYEAWDGRVRADQLYRYGSVLAGAIAAATHWIWVRRLPWEPWRRALLYLLLFATPPVALYFGYVESYGFLYVALTAFLLSSVLSLEGRAPLWLASTMFGAALFLHLSALFTAPALLLLGFLAPGSARRRCLSVIGPPALCLLLGIGLYLAAGYGWTEFQSEFLHSSQGRSIFLPLGGDRGLFSVLHWKDLANQLFLTAPVCLVVLLASGGELRRRWREPKILFLLGHIVLLALIRIVIDAKLGGAKDWDLVAAHSASLPILAAWMLGGARSGSRDTMRATYAEAGAVLALSILVAGSWVVLQRFEDRSLGRLIEVTADAPEETRTYVIEDVGRFYRDRQDFRRALRIYEECARRSPGHARLRAQLGALYYLTGNASAAEPELRAALRLDADTRLALELLAEITLASDREEEALALSRHLADVAPEPATTWELLGRAALARSSWDEAARAYGEAAARRPSPQNLTQHGLASLRAGRPADAARALRQAIATGADDGSTRLALAWALVEAAERAPERASSKNDLAEAERLLREELRSNPGDADLLQLLRRVEALR